MSLNLSRIVGLSFSNLLNGFADVFFSGHLWLWIKNSTHQRFLDPRCGENRCKIVENPKKLSYFTLLAVSAQSWIKQRSPVERDCLELSRCTFRIVLWLIPVPLVHLHRFAPLLGNSLCSCAASTTWLWCHFAWWQRRSSVGLRSNLSRY